MQDMGGCRAIVRTVRHLDDLTSIYKDLAHAKHRDYISNPKDDGYRSSHFVYKYQSNLRQNRPYRNLIIEVQLRLRLQHSWATAVETVDAFSRQSIKTGGGEDRWRRFFALMSSDIAAREDKPLVPGTPNGRSELANEIRAVVQELNVVRVLQGWASAIQLLPTQYDQTGASAFLLVLDTDANTMKVASFTDEQRARASEEYLTAEKQIEKKPSSQAVLVSVQSVRALRGAFPNYFADTRVFIEAVNRAVGTT
jgi:hypothetical protein